MKFSRIDAAIAECKGHLAKIGVSHPEIENLLAGYLLVFISAQFELRVMSLVEARAAKTSDKHIQDFVSHSARKIIRGPKIDQLTGMLGAFHKSCPKTFHDIAGDQAKTAYDSIINNRHLFVHEGICNVTIGDVERFFQDSCGVFSGIIAAFGLRASDVSHLI